MSGSHLQTSKGVNIPNHAANKSKREREREGGIETSGFLSSFSSSNVLRQGERRRSEGAAAQSCKNTYG